MQPEQPLPQVPPTPPQPGFQPPRPPLPPQQPTAPQQPYIQPQTAPVAQQQIAQPQPQAIPTQPGTPHAQPAMAPQFTPPAAPQRPSQFGQQAVFSSSPQPSRPTNQGSSNNKIWLWILAGGLPVLAIIGVILYLSLPKGSASAWCSAQYEFSQQDSSYEELIVSDSADKREEAARAFRDYAEKLQKVAPSEIKNDLNTYTKYIDHVISELQKEEGPAVNIPMPTEEESKSMTNIAEYSSKTCTVDGKVREQTEE